MVNPLDMPRTPCWATERKHHHALSSLPLSSSPTNTRHWTNVASMLARRLRRRPNIDPTVVWCLCLLGHLYIHSPLPTKYTNITQRVYVQLILILNISTVINSIYQLHSIWACLGVSRKPPRPTTLDPRPSTLDLIFKKNCLFL